MGEEALRTFLTVGDKAHSGAREARRARRRSKGLGLRLMARIQKS